MSSLLDPKLYQAIKEYEKGMVLIFSPASSGDFYGNISREFVHMTCVAEMLI